MPKKYLLSWALCAPMTHIQKTFCSIRKICCSSQIFNLSIPNLNLNWQTKADGATCFEIFELNQDFIIHGELEISRISKEGRIIWQRCGADIFTTIEGKEENFKLTDKFIFATDWGNRNYQFDFEGNGIENKN